MGPLEVLGIIIVTVLLLFITVLLYCVFKAIFVKNKAIRILYTELSEEAKITKCAEKLYNVLCDRTKVNSGNSYVDSLRSLEPINAYRSNGFMRALVYQYPLIHRHFVFKQVEKGYIYEYNKDASKSILIVIDVDDFGQSGKIKIGDKQIFSKGTYKDKATVFCWFEAIESLLSEGAIPKMNKSQGISSLGISSQGISSLGITILIKTKSNAALQILIEEDRNRKYDLVLTNGSGLVSPLTSGLKSFYAFVGVATTGFVKIRFETAKVSSGKTRLESFVNEFFNSSLFHAGYDYRMAKTLSSIGKDMTFANRMLFTNSGVFAPYISKMVDGSSSVTNFNNVVENVGKAMKTQFKCNEILEGENSYYVDVDFFLAVHEKKEDILIKVNRLSKKHNVSAKISISDPMHMTSIKTKEYKTVASTIIETLPNVYIAPFIATNVEDHAELNTLSKNVIRFNPIYYPQTSELSKGSDDENVPIQSLYMAINFYSRLVKKYLEE